MKGLPLKVNALVKKYGAQEAVREVSFEINEGEIFGLLGPNGAGKTSIISIITTLEEPTGGSVEVFDCDVVKDPIAAKSQLGVVHQEVIHTGFFNVQEVVRFHSGYYGLRKNKEREDFLLNRLGLWEHRDKKVKQLSGGMKRRLMIVKALVHSPKLLLLDEPTAGVDIALRESLWDFVGELKASGVAVLLTTHYLQEAEQLCDRVGIIHKGQIHAMGFTGEVVAKYTNRKIILSLSRPFDEISASMMGGCAGYQYSFVVPPDYTVMDVIHRHQIPMDLLIDVRIEDGSLEEAFVKIVHGNGVNS